ncbi:unnamed protein product, partial [Mesorhabditis belari]|uniref:Orcokinin n=1 Tax=Mesorhabditis belari TaxID=2138241 RepID=A0AAF3EI07_9BILA
MVRILSALVAFCLFLCTAAYPFLVLPSQSKRAFDRLDSSFHDFGIKKRAFDRLDSSYDFGLNLRKRAFDRLDSGYDFMAIKKRAFDRLDSGDFGFDRRRRAFDRLDSDFDFRKKRAFDRLDDGFELFKRSRGIEDYEMPDSDLVTELEQSISALRRARENEAAFSSLLQQPQEQLMVVEPDV